MAFVFQCMKSVSQFSGKGFTIHCSLYIVILYIEIVLKKHFIRCVCSLYRPCAVVFDYFTICNSLMCNAHSANF